MEARLPFGARLRMINAGIERKMNERFSDWELTGPQVQALYYLYQGEKNGESVNIRTMSQWLHKSHVTVLGIIDRLEQKGFVVSVADPADRRCRRVKLTEKAYEARAQVHSYRSYVDETLLQGLDPAEKQQLDRLLAKLLENVQKL